MKFALKMIFSTYKFVGKREGSINVPRPLSIYWIKKCLLDDDLLLFAHWMKVINLQPKKYFTAKASVTRMDDF